IDLENKSITMSKVEGRIVKDIIDDVTDEKRKELSYKIGEYIADIHELDIIHGDLTTSNMLIDNNNQLVFIDFGLSYYSNLIEDKADDLLVLKKSIKSVDYDVALETFNWILESYLRHSNNSDDIRDKIDEIEHRGRYTH
ncbi:MAG: KEOPS complex kinase/ATPase Bud32, partial [Methanobrevibacter sp.]